MILKERLLSSVSSGKHRGPFLLVRSVFTGVFLAFILTHFIAKMSLEFFEVSEHSMVPTLYPGDIVLIEKLSPVKAGDLLVFVEPGSSKRLLKRVQEITPGGYFMIGDNPAQSRDSRDFGPILQSTVVGRVIYIVTGSEHKHAVEVPGR